MINLTKVYQVPDADGVIESAAIEQVRVFLRDEQSRALALMASKLADVFLGFVELVHFDGAQLESSNE